MRHCDNVVNDAFAPACLKEFIYVHRLPAIEKSRLEVIPTCFADYKGKRVRLTMASRFGDVGITYDLTAVRGYVDRVHVEELSNFSSEG